MIRTLIILGSLFVAMSSSSQILDGDSVKVNFTNIGCYSVYNSFNINKSIIINDFNGNFYKWSIEANQLINIFNLDFIADRMAYDSNSNKIYLCGTDIITDSFQLRVYDYESFSLVTKKNYESCLSYIQCCSDDILIGNVEGDFNILNENLESIYGYNFKKEISCINVIDSSQFDVITIDGAIWRLNRIHKKYSINNIKDLTKIVFYIEQRGSLYIASGAKDYFILDKWYNILYQFPVFNSFPVITNKNEVTIFNNDNTFYKIVFNKNLSSLNSTPSITPMKTLTLYKIQPVIDTINSYNAYFYQLNIKNMSLIKFDSLFGFSGYSFNQKYFAFGKKNHFYIKKIDGEVILSYKLFENNEDVDLSYMNNNLSNISVFTSRKNHYTFNNKTKKYLTAQQFAYDLKGFEYIDNMDLYAINKGNIIDLEPIPYIKSGVVYLDDDKDIPAISLKSEVIRLTYDKWSKTLLIITADSNIYHYNLRLGKITNVRRFKAQPISIYQYKNENLFLFDNDMIIKEDIDKNLDTLYLKGLVSLNKVGNKQNMIAVTSNSIYEIDVKTMDTTLIVNHMEDRIVDAGILKKGSELIFIPILSNEKLGIDISSPYSVFVSGFTFENSIYLVDIFGNIITIKRTNKE